MAELNDGIHVFDVSKWKILLDGDRITTANSAFEIKTEDNNPYIILHLMVGSKVLKRFAPKQFKAIYLDRYTTVTINMDIENFKQLNFTAAGLDVDIALYGKPSIEYTD